MDDIPEVVPIPSSPSKQFETSELEANRSMWDKAAAIHLETPLYRGYLYNLETRGSCLLPVEEEELGDVSGLDVLHLMCHVGTDSLSLAKKGARVTGVDFSSIAIAKATELSKRLQIPATFVKAEISEVGELFANKFDLVFTSTGVLCWLPDLGLWARNVAEALRPGGRFYVNDTHPLVDALDQNNPKFLELRLTDVYLRQPRPIKFEENMNYAGVISEEKVEHYEFAWGLGDVVNSVLSAGLTLEYLREHPEGAWPFMEGVYKREDGHFCLPEGLHGKFPLSFSIQARKPLTANTYREMSPFESPKTARGISECFSSDCECDPPQSDVERITLDNG